MQKVISIQSQRVFSIHEATALLPVIYRITEAAHSEVKALINRLESIRSVNAEAAEQLENQIDAEVSRWQTKIEKLGGTPKGLWLADFDNGSGYYCWKFPETEISFCHGYQEGYSGRKAILDSVRENLEEMTNENSGRTDKPNFGKLSEKFTQDH